MSDTSVGANKLDVQSLGTHLALPEGQFRAQKATLPKSLMHWLKDWEETRQIFRSVDEHNHQFVQPPEGTFKSFDIGLETSVIFRYLERNL